MPQTEEAKIIWNKLDAHGRILSDLESNRKLDDHRLTTVERKQDEVCRQLVATETKIMLEIKENNKQLTELVASKHRDEGAEIALRRFYFCIGLLVALGQLVSMYRTLAN